MCQQFNRVNHDEPMVVIHCLSSPYMVLFLFASNPQSREFKLLVYNKRSLNREQTFSRRRDEMLNDYSLFTINYIFLIKMFKDYFIISDLQIKKSDNK